jgi:hypothetical protein
LRKDIRVWRGIYEQRYAPLRHRFYAHREKGLELGQLLVGTTIEEIERMLTFLGSVYEALWQLYVNGQELTLMPEPHSVLAMREAATGWRTGVDCSRTNR